MYISKEEISDQCHKQFDHITLSTIKTPLILFAHGSGLGDETFTPPGDLCIIPMNKTRHSLYYGEAHTMFETLINMSIKQLDMAFNYESDLYKPYFIKQITYCAHNKSKRCPNISLKLGGPEDVNVMGIYTFAPRDPQTKQCSLKKVCFFPTDPIYTTLEQFSKDIVQNKGYTGRILFVFCCRDQDEMEDELMEDLVPPEIAPQIIQRPNRHCSLIEAKVFSDLLVRRGNEARANWFKSYRAAKQHKNVKRRKRSILKNQHSRVKQHSHTPLKVQKRLSRRKKQYKHIHKQRKSSSLKLQPFPITYDVDGIEMLHGKPMLKGLIKRLTKSNS